MKELEDEYNSNYERQKNRHEDDKKRLNKEIDDLTNRLNQVKEKNKAEEKKVREEYQKNDR